MTHSPSLTASGLSVIVPAYNEAGAIKDTLGQLKNVLGSWGHPSELIVVNDGSSDETASVVTEAGIRVLNHPINIGYGRSLLTGIEAASYDTIAIIDADGTYPIEKLPDLLAYYDKGFHMVVAARQGKFYEGSFGKKILRTFFRWLAEFASGRTIPDINSGFRVFDRRPVLAWRKSLSQGFSFTTTITLLFMLNNFFVGYLPIPYSKRVGQSKVRLFRDSLRSGQIIFTMIAQFNPLKLYLLLILANLAGNFVGWDIPLPNNVVLAWNMTFLIASIGVLALVIIKPVVATNKFRED